MNVIKCRYVPYFYKFTKTLILCNVANYLHIVAQEINSKYLNILAVIVTQQFVLNEFHVF